VIRGLSINGRPQLGGLSGADKGEKASSASKTGIFLKFKGVRTDGGAGVEPMWTFCGQGWRESIFRDFCVDVFYE